MMGAATEKARLPRFSLVLGIESCCEVDDLSCLGMLEKCSITACTTSCLKCMLRQPLYFKLHARCNDDDNIALSLKFTILSQFH